MSSEIKEKEKPEFAIPNNEELEIFRQNLIVADLSEEKQIELIKKRSENLSVIIANIMAHMIFLRNQGKLPASEIISVADELQIILQVNLDYIEKFLPKSLKNFQLCYDIFHHLATLRHMLNYGINKEDFFYLFSTTPSALCDYINKDLSRTKNFRDGCDAVWVEVYPKIIRMIQADILPYSQSISGGHIHADDEKNYEQVFKKIFAAKISVKYFKYLPKKDYLRKSNEQRANECKKVLKRFMDNVHECLKENKTKPSPHVDKDLIEINNVFSAWDDFLHEIEKSKKSENLVGSRMSNAYMYYISYIFWYIKALDLRKKYMLDPEVGDYRINLVMLNLKKACTYFNKLIYQSDSFIVKYEHIRELNYAIQYEADEFEKIIRQRIEISGKPLIDVNINEEVEQIRKAKKPEYFHEAKLEGNKEKLRDSFNDILIALSAIFDKFDSNPEVYKVVMRRDFSEICFIVSTWVNAVEKLYSENKQDRYLMDIICLFHSMSTYVNYFFYNRNIIDDVSEKQKDFFNKMQDSLKMLKGILKNKSVAMPACINKMIKLIYAEIIKESLRLAKEDKLPEPGFILSAVADKKEQKQDDLPKVVDELVANLVISAHSAIGDANLDPRKLDQDQKLDEALRKKIIKEQASWHEKRKMDFSSFSDEDKNLGQFVIHYNICLTQIRLKDYKHAVAGLHSLVEMEKKLPGKAKSKLWLMQVNYLLGHCYRYGGEDSCARIDPEDNADKRFHMAVSTLAGLSASPLGKSPKFLLLHKHLQAALIENLDRVAYAPKIPDKKAVDKAPGSEELLPSAPSKSKKKAVLTKAPAIGEEKIPAPALQINIPSAMESICLDPRICRYEDRPSIIVEDSEEERAASKYLLQLKRQLKDCRLVSEEDKRYQISLMYQIILTEIKLNKFESAIDRLEELRQDKNLSECEKSEWWAIQIYYLMGYCYYHHTTNELLSLSQRLQKAQECFFQAQKLLSDTVLAVHPDKHASYALSIHAYLKKAAEHAHQEYITSSQQPKSKEERKRKPLHAAAAAAAEEKLTIAVADLVPAINLDPRKIGMQKLPGQLSALVRKKIERRKAQYLEDEEQLLADEKDTADFSPEERLHWFSLRYNICLAELKLGNLEAVITRLHALEHDPSVANIHSKWWPIQLNYLLGYCYYYRAIWAKTAEEIDHLAKVARHHLKKSLQLSQVLTKSLLTGQETALEICAHIEAVMKMAVKIAPKKREEARAAQPAACRAPADDKIGHLSKPRLEAESPISPHPLAEAAPMADYETLFAEAKAEAKEQVKKTWEEIQLCLAEISVSKTDEYQSRLMQHLPPIFELMCFIKKAFPKADIFLVGGALQQILAGQPITDLDFVTNLSMENPQVAAAVKWLGFKSRFIPQLLTRNIVVHQLFSTPGARIKGIHSIDVCYKPQISRAAFDASLSTDAKQGDVNISKIYLSPQSGVRLNIYDPHHGLRDLLQNKFSLIHSSKLNFNGDPYRLSRLFRLVYDKGLTAPRDLKSLLESPKKLAAICYPPDTPVTSKQQKTWLHILNNIFTKGLKDIVQRELINLAQHGMSFGRVEIGSDININIKVAFREKIISMLDHLHKIGLLNILFTLRDSVPAQNVDARDDKASPKSPPCLAEKGVNPWFIEYIANNLTEHYFNELWLIPPCRSTLAEKFLPLCTAIAIDPLVCAKKASMDGCKKTLEKFFQARTWLAECFIYDQADFTKFTAMILEDAPFKKAAEIRCPIKIRRQAYHSGFFPAAAAIGEVHQHLGFAQDYSYRKS